MGPSQSSIRERCFHPTGAFVEFPREEIEGSIVARFERQVRRYPDRLAVKTPGRRLTYAELDHVSNRVARGILRRRGEGAEPVAVLLPKTAALVVAVLGVLKAGKIYVLLDPRLPAARLGFILQDTGADLVLSAPEHIPTAAQLGARAQCLAVEEFEAAGSGDAPGIAAGPDDLAHILYTSGSTGIPKGVTENHRNVLQYILTETNDLRLCAEDRITFLASQGRDIFRALLNGASVHPVDVKQSGLAGLAQQLIDDEITVYNSVASTFREFAGSLAGQQFPRLRMVKVIGESLYPRDVQLFRRHFSPSCVLVNWYTSNEAGIISRYFVDHEIDIAGPTVPVGHVVPDKTVHVLAETGVAAAVDVPGELVVSSRFFSPGYWRAPELTAAAFRPDPVEEGARWYRIGDVGVRAADGCLTLLGRVDQQVKVRGFRVEVAEIETALLAMPDVREAVVVQRDDGPAHDPRRLVAYVVPARRPAPTVNALRAAVAAKVPDYMVPSVFVEMDRLPVIGIGKVDRRRLPPPGRARPALAEPYAAPRTPVETEIAGIWARALDLDQVGIDDHFLDLGGHSLLAVQIAAQVQSAFGIDVPLPALFAAPTIATLSSAVVERLVAQADPVRISDWLGPGS